MMSARADARTVEASTPTHPVCRAARYQQAVKRALESSGGGTGDIGGLLLAYPACFVMQLEGVAHDLSSVLRAMQADGGGVEVRLHAGLANSSVRRCVRDDKSRRCRQCAWCP